MSIDSPFVQPLAAALDHALNHLASTGTSSVAATVDLSTLRQRLDLQLNERGTDAAQVLNDLVRGTEGGILGSAGGRFFGWVIGGSPPAAPAAHRRTSRRAHDAG